MGNFKIKALKELWPFLRPNLRSGIIASVTLVFSTILALPLPLFIKYIIDTVVADMKGENLHLVISILIVIVILESTTSYLNQLFFYRFEQDVMYKIQSTLIERVIRFPKIFFDNIQTGYLMSRLNKDIFMLRDLFSQTAVQIFTNTLKFVGGVIILFMLHWKLALASLVILPFFYITVNSLGRKSRQKSHNAMEKSADVSKNLQESISGLTLIKSFGAEHREIKKLSRSLQNSIQAGVDRWRIGAFSQLLISLIASAGTILVLWYGAAEILGGRLTVGGFVAFNSYLSYLYGPARFMAGMVIQLQSAFAAFERVFELLNMVPEDEFDDQKLYIDKLDGKVDFQQVYFSYEKQENVLKDISFTVNPGETIAVVGPTGVGKSSMIKLLMKFYQPSDGKILLDGIDIKTIGLKSLRERIGMVSQDIFLFNDTIINNIGYANPAIGREEILRISKIARIHDFIMALPAGYETIVGERGDKLSVGQKQRISIARVLLKNPDILIFDEPTSALDAITEKTINAMLFEHSKGKTTFIIAHRLSTAMAADKILVLRNGSITQFGSHDQLFSQDGLYRQMFNEQSLSANSFPGTEKRPFYLVNHNIISRDSVLTNNK
jgi:ABC-type multidrug transport system fused ATPase/permease subunit